MQTPMPSHEIAYSVRPGSFNPKPEAMARIAMDRPHLASAITSGFGLNEEVIP